MLKSGRYCYSPSISYNPRIKKGETFKTAVPKNSFLVHHFCSGFTVYPFMLDPGLVFGEMDSLHIGFLLFSLLSHDLSKTKGKNTREYKLTLFLSICKQFSIAYRDRDNPSVLHPKFSLISPQFTSPLSSQLHSKEH